MYVISNRASSKRFAHHQFICTGNEGLEPANKLPLLPTEDKEDPNEDYGEK